MRILGKYVSASIIKAILSVLFALLMIFSFFTFLSEMEDVGTGSFDLMSAIYVVFLELPKLLYDLAPFATLIGAMLALGALADFNEIVAIRAAGGSKLHFLRITFRCAIILIIFVVALGELVVPFSEEKANRIKISLKKDTDLSMTSGGYWARDKNSFINMKGIVSEEIF